MTTMPFDLLPDSRPPIAPDAPERPMSSHYDVVIVGARAAGAATAMLLARRGLRVLAVDRSRYGSDTLSTHSLARTGVLQLGRWGLLDRLRQAGTPVARSVTFHYGGEPIVIDVEPDGDVDGLYSPRRTVLDSILVDEAIRSGAQVVHGVTMTGVTFDDCGRADGIDVDIEGVRCHIGATWVVGADGVRSRVARQVAAETMREESSTSAVVYAYWTGLPDDVIENYYDMTGRAAGIIPTNDGEACVWVAMPPGELRRIAQGDVRGAYHRAVATHRLLAESVHAATCVGGYRSFPGVAGFLRQAAGLGWALVGDAGYFKDPVSAHGITDAFVGAELLADALAAAVDSGDDSVVDRYRRTRDELAAALMPPVAALASLELDPVEAKAAFKQMNGALKMEWELMSVRAELATTAA